MKRILVTGGSRGLGLALCRRLLDDGCEVATCSRKATPEIQELLDRYPGRLAHHPVDFLERDSVARLVSSARVLDGFDGFVANAAVGIDGLLTLTAESAIRELMELNLIAPMLLAREVIKGMLAARKEGSLVFVSSVAARTGMTGLAAYSAAKGGLVALARALAREYGSRGIRSNAVLPGFLETDMTATLESSDRDRLVRRTPLGRLGYADDPVGAIVFLLSGAAAFVSGAEIVVDGGMLA